jgi:hypothetical protein
VGNRFDDQIRDGVRLRAPSNAPITAHSLRRIALPLLVALLTAIGFGFYVWAYAVLRLSADAAARNEPLVPDTALGGGVLLALLAVIVVAVSWRPAREVWQLLRSGAPADEVLADSARAVFDALRTSELIEFGVPDSALRIADRSGEVTCWLDGVGVSEGETFATCMRQLFEPVTDQRWLLQRTDGRVPLWMDLGITRIVVRIARRGARSPESWLAVPSVLARSGKRRDAFAAAWKRRVGGGRIVDGRSAEGAVARARARSTSASGRGIAEAWRSWS